MSAAALAVELAAALVDAAVVSADRRGQAEAVLVARLRASPPDLAADYRAEIARREAALRSDADELERIARRDTDPNDLGEGEG